MFDSIIKAVGQLISVVGIRTVEEPAHTVEELTKQVQIRRYGPRIAAETVVDGDETSSRSEGLRRIAGYIFGKNRGREHIAMTAPVGQQMAEPGWVVRFYMPADYSMESLPAPDDDRVRLVALPAESVAALKFSGVASPEAVATRKAELQEVLQEYGFETTGQATTWLYDPPWTIPFRRRNEVVVAITESAIVSNTRSTDIPLS